MTKRNNSNCEEKIETLQRQHSKLWGENRNSNSDNTQKLELTNIKILNCDKTEIVSKLKMPQTQN